MFGPPARFCKILISLLIFFFLTGLRTLIMHFSSFTIFTPSNTWWDQRSDTAHRLDSSVDLLPNIFHGQPCALFRSGPGNPTVLVDCLCKCELMGCPREKWGSVTIFIPHWTELRIDIAIYACDRFCWRSHHERVSLRNRKGRCFFLLTVREEILWSLIFTHGPMS